MTASTFTDDTVSELRALPNFFVEFNLVCGNDAKEIASLVIEFIPEWAPRGVYRVHELVSSSFFDQTGRDGDNSVFSSLLDPTPQAPCPPSGPVTPAATPLSFS